MADKFTEMMKKVIESKREKSAQQASSLRPDSKTRTEKASTRRKKH